MSSPHFLWVLRHGESAGNLALADALKKDLPRLELDIRDVDVPLSEKGIEQAAAVGTWLSELPQSERPTVVLSSPYVRARQTAEMVCSSLPGIALRFDERLREREFGLLDRLTKRGILEAYPEEAALRAHLKKFYYRPPGGESWCDVIQRLRGVWDELRRDYQDERVLIVCHTVVIYCFRYLAENLDEERVLAMDQANEMANCSLTSYCFAPAPSLEKFNFVAPLKEAEAPITRKTDVPTEAKKN